MDAQAQLRRAAIASESMELQDRLDELDAVWRGMQKRYRDDRKGIIRMIKEKREEYRTCETQPELPGISG